MYFFWRLCFLYSNLEYIFLLFFLALNTLVLLINSLLTKQHQKHSFYFYIQIKSLHKINLYEYTNSLQPYRKCIHTK